jgi:hypothetical protein
MHRAARGLVLMATLFGAGCAITPTPDMGAFARASGHNSFEVLNRRVAVEDTLVLPVVHDRQTLRPSCGAHALASAINYWRGPAVVTGDAIYARTPPVHPDGYSMAELMTIARGAGLMTSAVALSPEMIVRELERGRPVLVPVRVPSIFVQRRVLPGGDAPVIGLARNALINRAGQVSEWTRAAMVDHYLLVVGHSPEAFVVVEPVMGYRTLSIERFARYRRVFKDAAIVFSAQPAGVPAG